jgi:NAD(P)H dehydrogenase (quinone)
MHVYVLFAHPKRDSFTGNVLDAFLCGLRDVGHTYDLHDLYADGFEPLLDALQFERETSLNENGPLPEDVLREHERLEQAEGLVFIYPLWWSDIPAILKGWFDRVWSYGYAYFYDPAHLRGTQLKVCKAIAITPAGHTNELLEETGIAEAMRSIMVKDRLLGVGIPEARLEILGGLSGNPAAVREAHLETAYELGRSF